MFKQRAAELRRCPPVTDREHALADLDIGSHSGGAYRCVSLAGKEADEVGLAPIEEVI